MGPQLCSCGNAPAQTCCIMSYSSFNGAATLQLRKLLVGCDSDSAYDRFNGAATLQLRKPLPKGGTSIKWTALQWGRNFAVAETGDSPTQAGIALAASMGPQLCSCGNREKLITRKVPYRELQWGRNFAVAETGADPPTSDRPSLASMGPQLCSCGNSEQPNMVHQSRRRFNGAATLQLRKPGRFT